MPELLKNSHFIKDYKFFLIILGASFFSGIMSFFWQFWLVFGIILYSILLIYFSKELRDIFNIHAVVLSLIVLYAAPSIISILQGKIFLENEEALMLFSSITLGLMGYAFGALFYKKLFYKKNKKNVYLPKIINNLFWRSYEYRYILIFIAGIIIFFQGLMPMSYEASIAYRKDVPGVIQYFSSLLSTVFSVLIIAVISIVGDAKRYKKLSLFSYLMIALVVFSIIGSHRLWIIALFVTLILAFQPYLKRKQILTIIIFSFISTLVISGGVRAARTGRTFTENLNNFYNYFISAKNNNLNDLAWGFSDFTGPFSTFIVLVKNVPQNIGFDPMLPAKDLSLLIPTVIYPDRPLPTAKWFSKIFEPDIFEKGETVGFYFLGFGYLFAGPVGVFFYLFFLGIILDWLYNFFKTIGGAAGLFLYIYFFISLFSLVNGDGIISFIKVSFIMYFLIPVFLLFLTVIIFDSLALKKHRLSGKNISMTIP